LVGFIFGVGRSSYDPRSVGQLTGLDCSGTVGLVYQTNGVIIPRDADGQLFGSNHGPNVPIKDATIFFFLQMLLQIMFIMLCYISEMVI